MDLDTPQEGHFWGNVPTHCNIPIYEFLAHCLPAAAGKCAYPLHAADKCICCCEMWQNGDAAFCQITLDTCFGLKAESKSK